MKRKLNEHDVPEEVATAAETKEAETPKPMTFENLGLDARLLQAIAKEKYATPTPIQAKAIPLALEGRDILGTYLLSACSRSI
jgi:ATP-dependent RNA helicase DDX56/DBP9